MTDYPWYKLVDKSDGPQQGDLIYSCGIVIPVSDTHLGSVKGEITEYDVIVMSQSCDIIHKKIELVLVCPFAPLKDINEPLARSAKGREKFRQGNLPGYHLLNKCGIPGFETDFLVVDFRNVFGVPLDYLNKIQKARVRLLPPYREHLSQAFARFFMRVGLPIDIPPFTK